MHDDRVHELPGEMALVVPSAADGVNLLSSRQQTATRQWRDNWSLVSFDSSGTPGEEEEGEESKEDQQKVSKITQPIFRSLIGA